MERMNTQKKLKKMSRNVGSGSLALTLVGIFAAVMFIFSKAAWSQSAEWTIYNTSNSGLPYNGITVLDFDSQGNVWIGTGKWYVLGGGGLAKFDGENWTVFNTVFNTANSPLPHNDHFGLAVDPQGNVWSGTEGGLAKFDGEKWTVYKTSNSGLPNNRVATPVFDDQGHLWAGTWEGGLVKFDGVNWTVYTTANSGLPNNIPFATAFDKQGNLWIGTVGGGLVKFDGMNWTVFNKANSLLPNNTIFSICFDSRGNLWIATDGGGLAKFDGTNWIVFNTSNSDLPTNRSWFVVVDSHDNVWVGTYDRGMAMFDGKEWTVYNTSNSGLPDNMINYIAIDTQGKIWIATQNGGLAVYYPGNKMPIVDFNGDGIVDAADVCIMIDHWHTDYPLCDIAPTPFGDGIVDILDLIVLAEHLFEEFPPVEGKEVNVDEKDDGNQVKLEQGQILVVTLESNPTTGYSWEVVEIQESILEQMGEAEFKSSQTGEPPLVGVGGWEIFRFKAISAGQTTLQLVYHRPWEEDVEPLKTFSIQVVVN